MNGKARLAQVLIATSGLSGALLLTSPALAQSAAQLQAIENQIHSLEAQLKQMKAEMAKRDAAVKQAQDDAATARAQALAAQKAASSPAPAASVAAAPPGSLPVFIPHYDPTKPNGTFSLGGVTVTLGGYIDLTGIYRDPNETRGTGTSFAGIPFKQTPSAHTSEARLTAQQTRVSALVQGDVWDRGAVAAYLEADFNNAAGGANSVESSSYTPRLRQAYLTYTDKPLNGYVLAGQSWSLATGFKNGLNPRSEVIPQTIDSNYLPGFTWLRVPLVRVVKGFDINQQNKINVGLELDDPQTVFGGIAYTPGGATLTTTSAGNGGLNPQANYSISVAPDIIGKAAIDTAFGHYELYGLARFFQTRFSVTGSGVNHTTTGGGVGGTMFVPITKYFDVTGNILYGYGVGRYGAAGLPDVTVKGNGEPAPLREVMGTIGITAHATPTLDIYTYFGTEQIGRSSGSINGTAFGYGNYAFSNSGCSIEASTLPCAGNNYQVTGLALGAWWKVLQGSFGTVTTGLQYQYNERNAYRGTGGAPSAYENAVFGSIRYTPFQ